MRTGLLFQFALTNVKRNIKSYSIIMVLIMFGIAALILALSYIKLSFHGLAEGFIKQGLGHFQVMDDREYREKATFPLEFGLDGKTIQFVNDSLSNSYDDDVQVVMQRIKFSGIIAMGEKSTIFMGRGMEPAKESAFSSVFLQIKQGAYIGTDVDSKNSQYEVMVGVGLANIINAKVGDFITLMTTTVDGGLNAVDLKVVGLVSTGIKEIDSKLVFVNIKMAKELLRTEKISQLVIGLYDRAKGKMIHDFMYNTLSNSNLDSNIKSYYWEDLSDFYNSVVELYTQFFTFLGSLIVIVVISAVFGSVYNSVLERIGEIGILKANGFSKGDVLKVILFEISILGIVSAVVSYVFAFAMIALVNTMDITLPPPPSRTEGFPLLLLFIWEEGFYISLGIAIATILAALKPAIYGSNLRISEALRQ